MKAAICNKPFKIKLLASNFTIYMQKMLILALGLLAVACSSVAPHPNSTGPRGESMSFDQLVQSDFNRTVTMAMRDNLDSIYSLQEKLYKRNPIQVGRGGFIDLPNAISATREAIETAIPPAGMEGLKDIEVLIVAFEPNFQGDRVAAFIYGLADMILTAHNDKSRFYIADTLDPVHIHNAARNVEIAAWLLNSRKYDNGQPLLLANQMSDGHINISFEREMGQIVGRLDLIANLLDENVRRVSINYIQNLLFFSFLPVR